MPFVFNDLRHYEKPFCLFLFVSKQTINVHQGKLNDKVLYSFHKTITIRNVIGESITVKCYSKIIVTVPCTYNNRDKKNLLSEYVDCSHPNNDENSLFGKLYEKRM